MARGRVGIGAGAFAFALAGQALILLFASAAVAAPPSAPREAKVWDVSLQNVVFAPSSVTIEVGDMVKFTNKDAMCHTVTRGNAAGGDCIGSGSKAESDFDVVLNETESVTMTFATEGAVKIYCKPHFTSMTMTIQVNKVGTPPPKPTPGFETLALFAGLAGAAAVAAVMLARKRKEG